MIEWCILYNMHLKESVFEYLSIDVSMWKCAECKMLNVKTLIVN